jgi:hypothetical protein
MQTVEQVTCEDGKHVPDDPAGRGDIRPPVCRECYAVLCESCEQVAIFDGQMWCGPCGSAQDDGGALEGEVDHRPVPQVAIFDGQMWCGPCGSAQDDGGALEGEVDHRPVPARSGKRWDSAELAQLLAGYRSHQGIKELADAHGRSQGAIWSRLHQSGEIALSDIPERYRRVRD